MKTSAPPLEQYVAKILSSAGFVKVQTTRFIPAQTLAQPLWAHQHPAGKDIYGKPRKADFLAYSPEQKPNIIAIQCRSQNRSGTTEQKLPFEVMSIQQNEYDTIIVLDGGGFSTSARQWMDKQAGQGRLRHVVVPSELKDILLRKPWR